MGRGHSKTLWPLRKKAIDTLRGTGLYGYANEATIRTKAALTGGPLPELRFAIYGQGRTGSRLLCDLLNSHPDITCDLEILAERASNPRSLVEAHARLAKTRAHGFKFKYYQLTERHGVHDVGGFLRDLHDGGWRYLYLSRENVVRHALSSILRASTGVTHRLGDKPGDRSNEYPRVTVDIDELRTWIEQKREREALELEALGDLPRLDVVYDRDLVGADAQARATARIVEWLGLPPAEMTAKIRPNTPKKLSDLVDNLDELRRAFDGTDVRPYLEDTPDA